MKAFAASVFTMALIASPALAFPVDISFPNLTWPEEAPAPISQACADPAQLGTADCPSSD